MKHVVFEETVTHVSPREPDEEISVFVAWNSWVPNAIVLPQIWSN